MARLFKKWLHSFGISVMYFAEEIMNMNEKMFD